MDTHTDGFGSGNAKLGWKWKQMGNEEQAAAAAAAATVHGKIRRMSRPPPLNTTYASRLSRVFNKIIQLLWLKVLLLLLFILNLF